jgi:lysophospholipase L1-like esterase
VARFPLRLVVLGDSIAYGTGAERPDEGLGPRLVDALTAEDFAVDLSVVAVPGAESADLSAQVRRAEQLHAELAVIVIGANDLARFVPPVTTGPLLADAVRRLQEGGTDVVVVPAPDMSAVPGVPEAFRGLVAEASALMQRHQAEVAAAAGAAVVDVSELGRAFATEPALFSDDRFHPSSAGYARIAAALTPTVLTVARARRDSAAA